MVRRARKRSHETARGHARPVACAGHVSTSFHPDAPLPRPAAAAQAGGPFAALVQPLLDLASRDPRPVRAHRPAALGRLPQHGRCPEGLARLVGAARRHGLHGALHDHPGALRHLHGQRAGALVRPPSRQRAARTRGLLLRRVRAPRVAAHLLGRPGRPGRRSPDRGLRHGPAAGRRGALLPTRLLPPEHRRGRPPGARLRARWTPERLPLRRVVGPPRRAAPGAGRAAGPHRPRGRLAGPGRSRAAAPAGHGRARERRLGPAHHPHPVRPRARDAPPPGARAGHRRRARPARPGHRAVSLAPQRGPFGLHARGACPGADGGGRQPGRGLRAGPPIGRVHHPHAGPGRQRALRRRPRAAPRGAGAGHRRPGPRGASWRWAGRWTATSASST